MAKTQAATKAKTPKTSVSTPLPHQNKAFFDKNALFLAHSAEPVYMQH